MDHSHHHHEPPKMEKKDVAHSHHPKASSEKTPAATHAHHDMNPPMGHEGHDHHAMMIDDFKKRFWISLILTAPVLLLSEMIQHWLGFEIKFAGDTYVLFALSSFIFFYGKGYHSHHTNSRQFHKICFM